jgi:hypothetical protein
MSHPFFDSMVTNYPWERPEAVRLHEALYTAYPNPADIDRMYRQCASGLPPLALTAPPNVIWKEALESLTVHTGALRNLCDQSFTNVRLRDAVAAVVSAQLTPSVRRRITRENVIILDRVPLREKIEQISSDTSVVKVLLVRGDTQSGKSWGRYVMQSAARDRGAEFVYITSGTVASVKNVIERLFSTLGAFDEIPPTYSTDMAGYMTLCFKLQSVAVRARKQLWIAIDDLGHGPDGAPLLSPEIKEFFDQFALQMIDPSFSNWFRLMLIHYPEGKLPTKWKREILTEDRPSDADVQQADVAELLREWADANGRSIVQADLLELASDVIANADAPLPPEAEPVSRLQRINDELSRVLGGL